MWFRLLEAPAFLFLLVDNNTDNYVTSMVIELPPKEKKIRTPEKEEYINKCL